MQTVWYFVLLFAGLVLGVLIGRGQRRQTEYADNNTRREVEDIMYAAGSVKSEVEGAMVGFRRAGIVFFKQTQ